MLYKTRKYLIFPVTELDKVDFTQIKETSINTLSKSLDETKTFIKWDGEAPSFINELNNAEGPYTHDEILTILSTEQWVIQINET
jgi:hypothetical protein